MALVTMTGTIQSISQSLGIYPVSLVPSFLYKLGIGYNGQICFNEELIEYSHDIPLDILFTH